MVIVAGNSYRLGIRDQINPKGFGLDNAIPLIANDNPTGISPGYMFERPIDRQYTDNGVR